MRLNVAIIAIGLLVAGCERPIQGTGTIQVVLNPHTRKISLGITDSTDKRDSGPDATMSFQPSKGGKGEWNSAAVLAAEPVNLDNPYVVIRCFDDVRNAVRVEITFTGKPVQDLRKLKFEHVTRSENFRFKPAGSAEAAAYASHSQKGESLEVSIPAGDGSLTFLAWPHVH